MKKLAFGCLGVAMILAAVGAFWAYRYVVEPAREYLLAFNELGAIASLNAQVANKTSFVPPASGELTPDMIERFTRIQQAMIDQLGTRAAAIERRYRELERNARADSGAIDLRTLMDAYRDIAGALADAKRAQVEALNKAGLSLDEYRWMRDRVYEAAGLVVASVDVDAVRTAVDDRLEKVNLNLLPDNADAPARNRELVQPYLEQLRSWVPLAWFGF
jgi:hypothetical protein